jgi:hypothetical protein
MLRLALKLPARSQNLFQYAAFNSSAPINMLRPPLDLDPSLQALLKADDISLKNAKTLPKALRELEVLDNLTIMQHLPMDDWASLDISDIKVMESQRSGERKSPAALFGSQRIGMVILPSDLYSAIEQLIAGMHPMKKWRLSLFILVLRRKQITNQK